jgi:hypothetical protein
MEMVKQQQQQQQQQSQPGKLGVRVFATHDAAGENRTPIVNAEFTISSAQLKEPIAGTTGEDGSFTVEAPAGRDYKVAGEVFGQPFEQAQIEIEPACSSEVEFKVFVGLSLKSYIFKEDCSPPVECTNITSGRPVKLVTQHAIPPERLEKKAVRLSLSSSAGTMENFSEGANSVEAYLITDGAQGQVTLEAKISEVGSAFTVLRMILNVLRQLVTTIGGNVTVGLRRTALPATNDLPLWVVIKKSTDALAFDNYNRFMDIVLCGKTGGGEFAASEREFSNLERKRFLPYNDVEAYRLLKAATEAFVMINCGVGLKDYRGLFDGFDIDEVISRVGINLNLDQLRRFWDEYLEVVNGMKDPTLPYFALIREKLKDAPIMHGFLSDPAAPRVQRDCLGIIREKLTNPCLLELIWSYWHEEGMLVQTMNSVAMRFQNIRANTGGRDPLANLEIDPLRPLNNLFWGHIQDEQHRLSVARRAYEYDHHYGMSLYGKALSNFRPADSRSQFLEGFHNLLHLANIFFKEDDDTTMIADAFAVLNALKDVHLVLSEGAHNQFGDLPSTARIEMMMQQWLLARPEFREFLPTRIMVAYPEPWMDRVDAMKKLQGWTDTSILHFRNMAIFGEQIVLSIRYGSWSEVNNPAQAANWSRFWRAEIQGYIHAYRAATAVDLTLDAYNVKEVAQRSLPPSVHLRNRLSRQLQTV